MDSGGGESGLLTLLMIGSSFAWLFGFGGIVVFYSEDNTKGDNYHLSLFIHVKHGLLLYKAGLEDRNLSPYKK